MIKEIGSIWRRWDFHVHSPYSLLNNGFGNPNDDDVWNNYIFNLFTRELENGVGVIFITDYFLIEGYSKVRSILNDKTKMETIFKEEIAKDPDYINKVRQISVFPNIEFRLDDTVNNSKIQYHVLFSNDLDEQIISKRFLNRLFHKMDNTSYSCDISDISDFGNHCISKGIGTGVGENSLCVGLNSFSIKLDDVLNILEREAIFKDKYLLVCAEEDVNKIKWHSQVGSLREKLYHASSARFSAAPSDIAWGFAEDCIKTIGHELPAIFGSDSHNIESLFKSKYNHYCWVKSDKTFKGLIDAVANAKDRIFIGLEPGELISQKKRSGYSIKEVKIVAKTNEAKEHWIDDSVPLNQSMVSIIGNKGSGKSALADSIGLLGNSNKFTYFSFLNQNRFFHTSNQFSNNYSGTLSFYNGEKLNDIDLKKDFYDPSQIELVTYLPQRYIEKTCNEVDKRFFINEINNIIFSYLDEIDKDGFSNLNELIESRFEECNKDIFKVQNEIKNINKQLVKKLSFKTIAYRRALTVAKKEIEREIENHKLNKPKEVLKPKDEINSKMATLINQCNELLESIEKEYRSTFNEYKSIEEEYKNLIAIENSVKETKTLITDLNDLFKKHFDKYDNSVKFEIFLTGKDSKKYKEYKENLSKKYNFLREKLLNNESGIKNYDLDNLTIGHIKATIDSSVRYKEKIDNLNHLIELISKTVSDEQAAYQKYQIDLKNWNETLIFLEKGDDSNPSKQSLKSINDEFEYIDQSLSKEIEQLKIKRNEMVCELFDSFSRKNSELKGLYAPVQQQLNIILNDNSDRIAFDSRIVIDNKFVSLFDSFINHRVASGFKDANDLQNLVSETDFSSKENVCSFIKTILERAETDLDSFFGKMLKDENGQLDFINYLTTMQYLSIQYSLKMNDKPLEQLSPGEKGVVLLVFYLALDKNPKPLIIDQPEDNLDNQSIFTKLTKLIKYAKQNRQIIVVTHNPNIAVACDSEQIIYASIEQGTNKISYESGAIENPIMSRHIVDVLEGTMPAFDFRAQKYKNNLY